MAAEKIKNRFRTLYMNGFNAKFVDYLLILSVYDTQHKYVVCLSVCGQLTSRRWNH